MADRQALIAHYFHRGLTNLEIRALMNEHHDIIVSERHIKRLLNGMGLYRRKHRTDLATVVSFIENQLEDSGQLHGYKWMYHKCRQNNINVSREHVRIILNELDPEGVNHRRARRLVRRRYVTRGPNFVWHMDGYDKLKPFGIAIHGCIDGFSRNMVWLNASVSNNNPRLIAGYFVRAVSERGGCPRIIRADRGTENVVVSTLQQFLRRDADDPQVNRCFLYGTSLNNQRIESFWSILRKNFAQYWMDLFSFLREEGYFSGDALDKHLIRFCFMSMIQKRLDDFCLEWNFHYIRKSRVHHRPYGRPAIMSMLPAVYQTVDYLHPVDQGDIDICRAESEERPIHPCDPDVFDLALIMMEELALEAPENPLQGANVYLALRERMRRAVHLD